MLISVAAIAAGLVLLTYAADQFVIGAARVAARLQISTVVIGAVVIGFGTSAPEMVVSGIAATRGSLDIAVGNIIGSNVANLSLVLGGAAVVTAIAVPSGVMRREAPLSLAATVLFAVLVQGGLTRAEGIVLAVALAASLGYIIVAARDDDPVLSAEVDEMVDETAEIPLPREVLRTLVGLALTLAAAQILVGGATDIAGRLGVEEGFVGLTIIAIGTSLPELAASLQAARKRETDLVLGNLLGSNIFNSLAVGATAGLLGPGPVADASLTGLAVVLMLAVSVVATLFMLTRRRVGRWEGVGLLAAYLTVVPLLA